MLQQFQFFIQKNKKNNFVKKTEFFYFKIFYFKNSQRSYLKLFFFIEKSFLLSQSFILFNLKLIQTKKNSFYGRKGVIFLFCFNLSKLYFLFIIPKRTQKVVFFFLVFNSIYFFFEYNIVFNKNML